VRAVWVRRIWTPKLDPALDERHREACLKAARAGLVGSLGLLSRARWVDPPHAQVRAEDKLLQLALARELGLALPPTVVTNDPEALRAFFDEHEGDVVAKMLVPLSRGMRREGPFVPTSPVRAEDLGSAGGLRHAPMIFQRRVEKALELRVVCCGGRALVGAIDASGTAGRDDWRMSRPEEAAWRRAELPAEVARGLLGLVERLGLSFGVADLVQSPEGEHVFLELNPGGEWGMLERDLDLPVSEAIAATLLGEEARP
jgi:glutathione synthase/RimK-type ligase-like ATP-grasp enzyme